jgi:hypothetical protein
VEVRGVAGGVGAEEIGEGDRAGAGYEGVGGVGGVEVVSLVSISLLALLLCLRDFLGFSSTCVVKSRLSFI